MSKAEQLPTKEKSWLFVFSFNYIEPWMLSQLRGSAKLFQDKRYERPANQADPDKPLPSSEA